MYKGWVDSSGSVGTTNRLVCGGDVSRLAYVFIFGGL